MLFKQPPLMIISAPADPLYSAVSNHNQVGARASTPVGHGPRGRKELPGACTWHAAVSASSPLLPPGSQPIAEHSLLSRAQAPDGSAACQRHPERSRMLASGGAESDLHPDTARQRI
jgi:hypothetical protein